MGSFYLGDGLYAEYVGYQYRLFTYNGVVTTNEVFLDPDTLRSFQSFVERIEAGERGPVESEDQSLGDVLGVEDEREQP